MLISLLLGVLFCYQLLFQVLLLFLSVIIIIISYYCSYQLLLLLSVIIILISYYYSYQLLLFLLVIIILISYYYSYQLLLFLSVIIILISYYYSYQLLLFLSVIIILISYYYSYQLLLFLSVINTGDCSKTYLQFILGNTFLESGEQLSFGEPRPRSFHCIRHSKVRCHFLQLAEPQQNLRTIIDCLYIIIYIYINNVLQFYKKTYYIKLRLL